MVGIRVIFIFVNLHDQNLANAIVRELRKKGIYIRGGWPAPYSTGFSITGAPQQIMIKFFDEFVTTYYKLSQQ